MSTTNDHLLRMHACLDAREWAERYSTWEDIIDNCDRSHWLLWLDERMDILDDKERRLLAVYFVRKTPLADGRTVFDLLTDERSRNALVIAERYAEGKATAEELDAAGAAVRATAWTAAGAAARAAARAVAGAAARAAARDATWAAARAVARAVAGAAAWAAAGAAARDAAGDAARAHQAEYIRRKYGKRIIAALNKQYPTS